MRKTSLFTFIFLIFYFHLSYSQKNEPADSIQKKDQAQFTPFLAPSYAPETKFMLIAGGLYSFKTDPYEENLSSSSLPFSIGYSTNKSFLFNARPYAYFNQDKFKIYGDLWVKIMPDHYWGVGYEKNSRIEEGENTTSYFRKWWKADLRAIYKVYKDIFAGIVVDINTTIASDLNPLMQNDPAIMEFGKKIHNRGLGINLEYDTRDVAVNAYQGKLINISSTFYGEYLNSDYNYQIHILDYRQYEEIVRTGRVLAWQVKSRIGAGEVPWPELSQPGTPFDLRAYYWGHYRDRNMIFGLLEYRHMFLRNTPDENGDKVSRHGAVIWVGGGSIAPNVRSFTHWLPNAGIGYRFEVQDRLNARVDFGIGRKASGFYVSFSEAF